jgi:hypothetical protein
MLVKAAGPRTGSQHHCRFGKPQLLFSSVEGGDEKRLPFLDKQKSKLEEPSGDGYQIFVSLDVWDEVEDMAEVLVQTKVAAATRIGSS